MIFSYLVYLLRVLLVIIANCFKKAIPSPDYVTFTLHGSYPDLRQPPEGLLQRRIKGRIKSIQELADDFRTVAKNPDARGIILHIGKPELSLSQIQTLSRAIKEVRAKNKEVIAWATNYHMQNYSLAAAADRILLQEGGMVYTLGLASRQLYMKNTLDWCGIEFDVVQISPYKSALERFIRSNMSDEVKEMYEWLMNSFYDQFFQAVATGRDMETDKVQEMIASTPLHGGNAVSSGAVDDIINAEDLPEYLSSKEKPARLASWDECSKSFTRPLPPLPGRYIAVLRVQGNIIDGKSQRPPARPPLPVPFLFNEQTGDLTFVQQARQVLRDKRAKAVLLYIDSGGGSAASSEAISSILGKISAKKPLVALMGSMAGSGGYYVATPANYIVAQPASITGSIGVITAKIVNSRLLEKLLLNRETIEKGQKDLFGSPEEPFTEEERNKAWEFINHIYELFVKRVSDSRGMAPEKVKEVGGGKVWTGEQALKYGLVDELGGLETALAKLRSLAALPESTPLIDIPYPRRETAPLPTAANWFDYALTNLEQIKDGRALYAGPLYFQQPIKKI
ncbi:MAG: signal peptide peptidase SppA [Bacillota bacterium]